MIKRCLIGEKYTDEIKELNDLGIETVTLSQNINLDSEINCHADILSFNLGNKTLIADSSLIGELENVLGDYKIIPCINIKSPYPNDVNLNAALLGNKLICNTKYISSYIVAYAENNGINILHSNQGYTKCNLCVLNDNAVITEDTGLSSLLKNSQIDVLLIKPGYVSLSAKHYGFIGGAGCMISETEIYFSGNISAHPDYNKIIDFLNKYSIKPIFNINRPLTDFGGFVAL